MSVFDKIKIGLCVGLAFLACSDDQEKKLASGYTEEQNAGIYDQELVKLLRTWEPDVPVDSTERTVTVDSSTYSWYEIQFTTDPETYFEYVDAPTASCTVNVFKHENGVRLDMRWSETSNVYTEILMRDSAQAVVVDRLDNSYEADSAAQCVQDSSAFVEECEDNDGLVEDLLQSASCVELHLVCTKKFTPKVDAGKFMENTARKLQRRCEDKFSLEHTGEDPVDDINASNDNKNSTDNKGASVFDSIMVDSRDGQTYKAVVVNGQNWMAENLKYDAGEASLCYGEVEENCEVYGRLYNWDSLLCPTGWRLPSVDEYRALVEFADDDVSRLKSTTGWATPGTDDYGLNFLPGGMCSTADDGVYVGMGEELCLWTSDYMGMAVDVDIDNTGDLRMITKYAFRYVRCLQE